MYIVTARYKVIYIAGIGINDLACLVRLWHRSFIVTNIIYLFLEYGLAMGGGNGKLKFFCIEYTRAVLYKI